MATILHTASYVRSDYGRAQASRAPSLDAILQNEEWCAHRASEAVWKLLETPQTIQTICRAVCDESGTDPQTCGRIVEGLLAKLYDEDLIEVLPDS